MTQFPIFKGLQKPLEFMGIRGRFLIYAACAFGLSFLGFFLCAVIFDKFIGFVVMVVMAGLSTVYIFIKQKRGLHDKRIDRGIFIYHNLFKRD